MKPKQKQPNEVPHLNKITGSPGLTAVSDAAQGKKPDTMAEFEDNYHNMWSEGRMTGDQTKSPMASSSACDTSDVEEAYALLFEGLAMLARNHSQEEDQEESSDGDGTDPESPSEDKTDKKTGSCDCCESGCSCNDCANC